MKQVLNELGEVVRRDVAGLLAHGLEQVGGFIRFDGDPDASLDSECLELDVIRVVHLDERLDGCLVEIVLLLRIQIERFLVWGLTAAKAGGQLPRDPSILLPDILVKLDVRPDLLDQEAQQVLLHAIEEDVVLLAVLGRVGLNPAVRLETLCHYSLVDLEDLKDGKVIDSFHLGRIDLAQNDALHLVDTVYGALIQQVLRQYVDLHNLFSIDVLQDVLAFLLYLIGSVQESGLLDASLESQAITFVHVCLKLGET